MSPIQIVFASYRCAEPLRRAISSLALCDRSEQLEIIIVENDGEAFSYSGLDVDRFRAFQVLKPKDNLGYFGAMSFAFDATHATEYAYRILCNPDIEFVQRDFFSRLYSLELLDDVAIVAPSVRCTKTGSMQNPYMRSAPQFTRRLWWRVLYGSRVVYFLRFLAERIKMSTEQASGVEESNTGALPEKIYAPHGSMLIFREPFFRKRDLLKLIPFLYAEELFIGEICARANLSVTFVPSLFVLHRSNAVTGLMPVWTRFALQRKAIKAFLNYY